MTIRQRFDYYIPWESLLLIMTRTASAFCIAFAALFGGICAAKATGLLRRGPSWEARDADLEAQADAAALERARVAWEGRR